MTNEQIKAQIEHLEQRKNKPRTPKKDVPKIEAEIERLKGILKG